MIKVRDRCGIFVKKERECRMSTPTPLSDPSYFNGNGCYLTHAHNHITWVVAAMNSCVPKTVYFIHQGKYILGLGKEQNILI